MARRKAPEREHDFALVLAGIVELTPQAEDALFEAGCDDATLSVRAGRVFATFSRTAPSLKDAILSAIRDVKKANVGAAVFRVDICNLVSQAEIARRIGRTRQLVHQYLTGTRGPGGFPAPACDLTDGTPLWSWCEVADWLSRNDMIQESILRDAKDVAAINSVLDFEQQRRRDPTLITELLRSLSGPQKRSSA
jgi:hypothetical protein